MLPDESAYIACLSKDIPTAAYSPLVGSMMIGSAFNVAAGALMLKQQRPLCDPGAGQPAWHPHAHGVGGGPLEAIRCTGYNCYGERTVII